ncbi:TPA: hypothetical protein SLO96_002986 [Proteus mirabilis]|nr:hypothetical protein [Proteus mirabilis]
MAKRKPLVYGNKRHGVMEEGDTLDIPLSADKGNTLVNKEDGLFASPSTVYLSQDDFTGKGTLDSPYRMRIAPGDDNQLELLSVVGESGLKAIPAHQQITSKTLSVTKQVVAGNNKNKTALELKVSSEKDNSIEVKADGIYVPKQEAQAGGLEFVTTDDSLTGNGTTKTPLGVQVSSASDNTLQKTEAGLVVKPQRCIRGIYDMNLSLSYADNPTAYYACGYLGGNFYIRASVALVNFVPPGDTGAFMDPNLITFPCMEDGTLVPYNIFIERDTSGDNEEYLVHHVFLLCQGKPTHYINKSTGEIVKLYKSSYQGPSGATHIPEGSEPNDLICRLPYIYLAKE